jgi:hypothetical protein
MADLNDRAAAHAAMIRRHQEAKARIRQAEEAARAQRAQREENAVSTLTPRTDEQAIEEAKNWYAREVAFLTLEGRPYEDNTWAQKIKAEADKLTTRLPGDRRVYNGGRGADDVYRYHRAASYIAYRRHTAAIENPTIEVAANVLYQLYDHLLRMVAEGEDVEGQIVEVTALFAEQAPGWLDARLHEDIEQIEGMLA